MVASIVGVSCLIFAISSVGGYLKIMTATN